MHYLILLGNTILWLKNNRQRIIGCPNYLFRSRVAALLINLLYSLSAHATREHEQQRECKQNLLHNIVQIGYCSFYSWGAAASASSRYLDM